MESLSSRFKEIVAECRQKRYDLLAFEDAQFDRDHQVFNQNVEELETALQVFINSSFENISSTENALNLLKTFQSILHRENLKVRVIDCLCIVRCLFSYGGRCKSSEIWSPSIWSSSTTMDSTWRMHRKHTRSTSINRPW